MLEAAFEDVELSDGRYQVKGVAGEEPDAGRDRRAARTARRWRRASSPASRPRTSSARPSSSIRSAPTWRWSRWTATPGTWRSAQFFSVDDCGVRISPMLVDGQVHGGLAQGVAQALLEEVVYDADGQLVTGSLMDYAMPRAEDLPSFTTDQTVTRDAEQPARRQGHRRGGHHRLDAGGGQRGGGRAAPVRRAPPRHAAPRRARVAGARRGSDDSPTTWLGRRCRHGHADDVLVGVVRGDRERGGLGPR